MDVIVVLVFFSLGLVVAGLLLFFHRLHDGDFEHGERLSLLPLADDDGMNKMDAIDGENTGDKPGPLGSNGARNSDAPPPPA